MLGFPLCPSHPTMRDDEVVLCLPVWETALPLGVHNLYAVPWQPDTILCRKQDPNNCPCRVLLAH